MRHLIELALVDPGLGERDVLLGMFWYTKKNLNIYFTHPGLHSLYSILVYICRSDSICIYHFNYLCFMQVQIRIYI